MHQFADRLLLAATKAGGQRHLAAIRDSFASLMPLLIIGSLATLCNQIPGIVNAALGWGALTMPSFLAALNGSIWWGTFDMVGLYAVFAVAYHLAKGYGSDPLAAGLTALSAYLCIIPQTVEVAAEEGVLAAWGNVNRSYTNAQGLFVGLLVAVLTAELFIRLNGIARLHITMPQGVPPAVGRSFSALAPAGISIAAITALVLAVEAIFGDDIFSLIGGAVSAPLLEVADSLGYALLMVSATHLLWFFGLHGANILEGIVQPISLPMMEANTYAFQAGEPIPHIVTKPFLDTFVYLGGAGAVLGMVLSMLWICRSKRYRAVAKLSVAPAAFHINEPVLFGMPIVLNPLLLIPFLLAPLAITVLSYAATYLNLVPRVVAVIPWATPPILSGLIATGGSWRAAALQAVNILVTALIYLPFVRAADRMEQKREAGEAGGASQSNQGGAT